jgi:hypothetical protein
MQGDSTKIEWNGTILAIQPRTRVWRYLTDNRTHYHIGFNIFLDGCADGIDRQFVIAISEKQQQSGGFGIGDTVSGTAWIKQYPEREFADYYRAGALKRVKNGKPIITNNSPPWIGQPCQMSKSFGILTERLVNTDLRVFAMALNHVNCTRWAKPVLFPIKTWGHHWTRAGLMTSVQKIVIGMIESEGMRTMENTFIAPICLFEREKGWHYVSVPPELSVPLENFADRGLIAITARIGSSSWATSMLPMGDGTHFIALPARVRQKEKLSLGSKIEISFVIRSR